MHKYVRHTFRLFHNGASVRPYENGDLVTRNGTNRYKFAKLELKNVETQINSVRNEMNSIRNEVNVKVDSLRNEMSSMREEMNAKFDTINANVDGMRKEMGSMREEIKTVDEKINSNINRATFKAVILIGTITSGIIGLSTKFGWAITFNIITPEPSPQPSRQPPTASQSKH
ncbi:10398_t:CDS:1 [Paraglomus occultum]|uniref:10398_t:CDS:1 n=1 Tax=Paraglomus occultum TaxID=144539 RepID=A0A9N9G0V6_9GLOM|nr:10398_t:CDS:1 [Paraglomus occultum]